MNEFRIISPEKEEIVIVPTLPDELMSRKLAGAEIIMAKGLFGQMIFQHFKGDKICLSRTTINNISE